MSSERKTGWLRIEVPGARPLSARSVVASVLLGTHPPRLPGAALVRAGQLFEIPEGTIRVALSRMVAAGELRGVDGSYELAGRLLERQSRQDTSRRPSMRPWNGLWLLAVVALERRRPAARSQLRAAAAAIGMAEAREGVWLRPDNLDPRSLEPERAVVEDQCWQFTARLEEDPMLLVRTLWDLDGWARVASSLQHAMATVSGALARGDDGWLPTGFALSAAVLRHFLADPLLPAELLPATWPGDALRSDYEAFDVSFRAALARWSRAQH